MRYFFLNIVCLVHFSDLLAQESVRSFYNAKGEETDSASSFYYVSWTKVQMTSYYTSTGNFRYTELMSDSSGISQGTYYYPNGKIKAEGKFHMGNPAGQINSYYSSGSPQSELIYEDKRKGGDPVIGIINYWDSLGTAVVKDGKGYCVCNLAPTSDKIVLEKGDVEDGLKKGEWQGQGRNVELNYKEWYSEGVLIRGIRYAEGKEFEYKVRNILASQTGDFSFYKHVGNSIRYPTRARRKSIQGKVFVEFFVNENGFISDFKVVKGIDNDCDAEALKAVSSGPKWNPGMQYGRPVKQRMTLPIEFKLQ